MFSQFSSACAGKSPRVWSTWLIGELYIETLLQETACTLILQSILGVSLSRQLISHPKDGRAGPADPASAGPMF